MTYDLTHDVTDLDADSDTDNRPDVPPLPDHVYLKPDDDPEETIQEVLEHYDTLWERAASEYHDRLLDRETRYEEDDDAFPSFPIISRTVSRAPKHAQKYLVLPDGRRVRRLYSRDPHHFRIETLCGVRQILSMDQAISLFRTKQGSRECPRCHGRHLPTSPTPAASVSSTDVRPPVSSPACPKCGHNQAGLYQEDDFTLACVMCGYRRYLPLPSLSDDELAHNEQAIDDWVFHYGGSSDIEEPDEALEADEAVVFNEGLSIFELPDERLSETVAEIADQLHFPAYRLYRTTSPLRQQMLSRTLLSGELDQQNMLRWIAAGRLADELGWIDHDRSAELVEWLWSVDQSTLETIAGDESSPIALLAHPTAEVLEPSERWIRGLRDHLVAIVSRCKPTPATVQGLARRFRLTPAAIERLMAQAGCSVAA